MSERFWAAAIYAAGVGAWFALIVALMARRVDIKRGIDRLLSRWYVPRDRYDRAVLSALQWEVTATLLRDRDQIVTYHVDSTGHYWPVTGMPCHDYPT